MPYLSLGSTIPAQILNGLESREPGLMGIVSATAATQGEFSAAGQSDWDPGDAVVVGGGSGG
jgi:hypothetical protein